MPYDPMAMNASQLQPGMQLDPATAMLMQMGPLNAGMQMQQPVMPASPMQPPPKPQADYLNQVLAQQQQDKQSAQSNGGLIQQILSQRMQPTMQDVADTSYQRGMNPTEAISANQVMANNINQQLSPYSTALGLQKSAMENRYYPQLQEAAVQKAQIENQFAPAKAQSEIGLQGAQAKSLNDALKRQLAVLQYTYANDPQMAQAKMMAAYMASLGGQNQQPNAASTMPTQGMNAAPQQREASFMPPNTGVIAAQKQQNNVSQQQNPQSAQPQGIGFNPMGAMLAKSLGLTDMQIGPNGQPMPIPGASKIENGEVITFGPNGVPTKTIPKNPGASSAIDNTAQFLSDKLDELKTAGSAVSESQSYLQNMGNRIGNTESAQWFQPGSKANTIIASMAKYIMQAMPDYMQAKGITPGMERTVEGQKMILNSVGVDPTQNIEASKEGLKNLSNIAGTGQYARTSASQLMPTIAGPQDPLFQRLPSGAKFKATDGRTMVKH